MKKTAIRYGLYSGAILMVTVCLNYAINANRHNYRQEEIGGYLSIIISMVFVYLGIRQYRDKESGGAITYVQALKVGLLIILLPSILFGVFDIIYVKLLDPGFMERYYNQSIEQMKATLPPDVLNAKLKEMEQGKAMFGNVFFQFMIMALTVFLIGVAATAISALALSRKPKLDIKQ